MKWDRLIEEKIRAAQAEGKFDNLRGKGQPLKVDEDPFEDPAWQMANQLLKDNGFRPDWLEDDVELRARLTEARQTLARSHQWRAAELSALAGREDAESIQKRLWVDDEWQRALKRFTEAIQRLNKAIATFNLKVPSTRFQRRILVLEDELARALQNI